MGVTVTAACWLAAVVRRRPGSPAFVVLKLAWDTLKNVGRVWISNAAVAQALVKVGAW